MYLGPRRILILSPVVRYLMKPCCDMTDHCTSTRNRDADIAGRAVLDDLSDLHYKLKNRFTTGSVSFISTEDLLCGKDSASRTEILDNLENCWSSNRYTATSSRTQKSPWGSLTSSRVTARILETYEWASTPKKRFREWSPSPTRMPRERSRERS